MLCGRCGVISTTDTWLHMFLTDYSSALLLCTPRARPTHTLSKMPADDDAPKMEGGKDTSLSIQETNKLRAKLGLRALDVGEKV